ncbi:MAG: flagellar assembly protein FliW [Solirubrobacteraceae bacterium]|nr:flagellar assembly protein FliW [Solirubrobacteraceae bacterium]
MSITLNSARFGTVEIAEDGVIEFPTGLIGIDSHRYALLGQGDGSAFVWLHSLDDPTFALPVMSPWPVFVDYAVEISDGEAERIGISEADDTQVYVTVRASDDPAECSVNLRAPILISGGRGYQVINESSAAPVRAPLFPEAITADGSSPQAASAASSAA